MRLSRLFTATAALVVLAAAPAMAQEARPAATDAQRRAQIEANDLSARQARSLQARVDRVIARTGGTQVAINQVVWDGGDTLVPLPGERRARELGPDSTPSALSPRSLRESDNCEYYQFCTYFGPYFTGIQTRMVSCVLHDGRGIFQSYINNQTPGTRARFYDSAVELIETTPPALMAAPAYDPMDASAVWYIRPC
jgi:hypothetical protein